MSSRSSLPSRNPAESLESRSSSLKACRASSSAIVRERLDVRQNAKYTNYSRSHDKDGVRSKRARTMTSSACLPPLRPIFARMNPGSFMKSNFKKKARPVHVIKQEEEEATVTETEPTPPPSQPRSVSDSDKEVHISQCSLEYDSEKEVHHPAKNVVARVLSPEPRERNGSFEDKQQHPASVNSKSPTPSYRTVDSSQDPEVVPDQQFPAIDEEPEEMIEQGEDEDEEEELASDAESENDIHLPLQDFDGRDIVPHNARLHRPPSWDYGVPLWPIMTNASVVSGIGGYADPVSPMSPTQEKKAFNFPPPSDIKSPTTNKRNSWRDAISPREISWI